MTYKILTDLDRTRNSFGKYLRAFNGSITMDPCCYRTPFRSAPPGSEEWRSEHLLAQPTNGDVVFREDSRVAP